MNKNTARGVAWVKPSEPSFLKKFKSDVGYKEGPTTDTKRQVMPALDDDSGSDKEEESPQVVVLKTGDLTAEEVKKVKEELRGGDGVETGEAHLDGLGSSTLPLNPSPPVCSTDDGGPSDGKILFKKPAGRSSDRFQGITASSSRKRRSGEGQREDEKKEVRPGKKVKNSSLLSFGGEEEEEED